jgi:hypothetical protein
MAYGGLNGRGGGMTTTFPARLNAQLERLRRLANQHAESCGVSPGLLLFKLCGLVAHVDREHKDDVVFLATFLAQAREMIRSMRVSEAARRDLESTRRALEEQLTAPGSSPLFCRSCGHAHKNAACAMDCGCELRTVSATCACEAHACPCSRERIRWWLSASAVDVR